MERLLDEWLMEVFRICDQHGGIDKCVVLIPAPEYTGTLLVADGRLPDETRQRYLSIAEYILAQH